MDPAIFITYSSKDQKVSRTICTALENRGLTCWISSRNVKPGQNYQEQIVKAIRAAKIMVLVFTANANNSNEIKKELALASQNNLIVIPVRIEDVTPNEAFAYEFATRQWIDLFGDWENSIAHLVEMIAAVIEDHPSGERAPAAAKRSDTLGTLGEEPAQRKAWHPPRRALLAGVLGVALIGSVGVWFADIYRSPVPLALTPVQPSLATVPTQLSRVQPPPAATQAAAAPPNGQTGISPADIKRLGDSTVFIRNRWQLYDSQTNRPIYQRMANVDGEWLPCYVKMDSGDLVRWLTLDNDRNSDYAQIGGTEFGSGFVIGAQGLIITSNATGAAWTSPYEDFSSLNGGRGAIFSLSNKGGPNAVKGRIDSDLLKGWVPESGGWLFQSTLPYPISNDTREFFGRNEALSVQLPGEGSNINANLVRSIDAGVAELKIDVSQPLSKLELADDDSVRVGDKIILLGYFGASNKTPAVQETNAAGQSRTQDVYIPKPTEAEGVVKDLQTSADEKAHGAAGNNYRLDIDAGPGSYGSPVLNAAGKVIGVISPLSTFGHHVAFAVPIKYVHELLQPQRRQ
jgi:S1-C subfamily serine protease